MLTFFIIILHNYYLHKLKYSWKIPSAFNSTKSFSRIFRSNPPHFLSDSLSLEPSGQRDALCFFYYPTLNEKGQSKRKSCFTAVRY